MREVSDPSLTSRIRRYGVFNANGCFNCGGCTISCELTDGNASFPRQVMQAGLLGLNDSVRQSFGPWICHDCGDCSDVCPREAKPRESLATLRRYLVAEYDWTGLAGRICASRAWEMAALSIASGLVLALIILYHLYVGKVDSTTLRTTAMGMEHMFPRITYFTVAVFLLPLFFLVTNAIRMFVFTMRRGPNREIGLKFYLAQAKTLLVEAITQKEFLKCPAKLEKRKWIIHWFLAFGFTLLFVIKLFFLRWFQTDKIYAFYHPQRWLGYLGFACLVAAASEFLFERYRNRPPFRQQSVFGDWMVPAMLILTAVSGLGVHLLRYAGFGLSAHYCYAAHLMVAVPLLAVELPFGKSSHMLYRPLALYFDAVRKMASRETDARDNQTVEKGAAA